MKTPVKLIVSILALGLAASFTRAADEAPKADKPAKGERGEMRGNIQERMKEISEKLALTEEQKTKIADIFKAGAAERKEIHGDRAKAAEFMKSQREQIRAVLTPEQQAKFDAMKQGRRPHGKRGEKAGKAE